MSKLTDIAFGKIEELNKKLSEAGARLVEREAQLTIANEALAAIRERGIQGGAGTTGDIASAALARLSQPEALLQELRGNIRRQTAQECVSLIYPDGNPEIAIRRIKQDFGLAPVPERV